MSWLRKKLRKLEKRFGPQIVERRIGEFNLRMHRDHVLPIKLAKFPNYSANVPRIAALLVEKYPGMALGDVGANIGDTVALVRSKVTCPIVCIEGDEEFFSLLKGNTSQFKDVTLFSNFVSDGDARMAGEVVRHDGTAHLVANDGKSVDVTTLDSLKEQHAAAFENVRLLKIDTDGYDLRVIRGARRLLKTARPVLFFEYSPDHMAAVGDHQPMQVFDELGNLGYDRLLFYDNFGRYVLASSISERAILRELTAYAGMDPLRRINYFDIAAFSPPDFEIAEKLRAIELAA